MKREKRTEGEGDSNKLKRKEEGKGERLTMTNRDMTVTACIDTCAWYMRATPTCGIGLQSG